MVQCDLQISRQCIYGVADTANAFSPLCNYLLCEGHSRGCPPDKCDKFVQIDKDHPRKLSKKAKDIFTKQPSNKWSDYK